MQFIFSLLVAGSCGTAEFPSWLPLGTKYQILAIKGDFASISQEYDILASYAEPAARQRYFTGVSRIPVGGFSALLTKLSPVPVSEFCLFFVDRFFVKRPSWFTPSLAEIEDARTCFTTYLEILRAACSQPTEDCVEFADIITKLSRPLFSELTHQVRSRPLPALNPAVRSDVAAFVQRYDTIRGPVERAFALYTTSEKSDSLDSEIWNLYPENGASFGHISDFLDHYGFSRHTLHIWKAFLETPELDRLLIEEAGRKTAIRVQPGKEQLMRLFGYKKISDEQLWHMDIRQLTMRFRPTHGGKMAIRREQENFFLSCDTDNGGQQLLSIYRCVSEGVANGETEIAHKSDEEFMSSVAALLYMIKVTRDPLAFMVQAQ